MAGELLIPPWLRISATAPRFGSNSTSGESIFTQSVRSTERPGDKVRATLNTESASKRESDPNLALLMAIRAAIRGQGGRLWYSPVGYSIHGSYAAAEHLTNGKFGSGTTSWGLSNSSVALSATDRVLRVKRLLNNATNVSVQNTTSFAVTPFTPYLYRAYIASGRGSINCQLRAGSSLAQLAMNDFSSASITTQGMHSFVVYPDATPFYFGIRDVAGSKLAGDYMDVLYASVTPCPVVDNGQNLLLQSDEFDTSWTLTNATVDDQAAGTTAPDGTSTADSLIEDASSNVHRVEQNVTVAADAADFCFAIALKAGSRTWARLLIQENTGSSDLRCFFNLSNGDVGTITNGANIINGRAFTVSLGDGWRVCILIGRKTNAATSLTARVSTSTGDGVNAPTGTGTENIYLWRATFAQSSVPVRLVHTTTTALPGGTLQTGLGLHLKGLPPSVEGLLRYGAWVQTGKQLAMVTARLDSDAAGRGYLQLAYPPKTPPPDGDPIIVHEPFGRFYSMDAEAGWNERGGGFSDHEWNICEALDA